MDLVKGITRANENEADGSTERWFLAGEPTASSVLAYSCPQRRRDLRRDGVTFASIPSAHGAPTPAPKQVCTEHDVHLHGSQPATISCGAYQSTGSSIVPETTGDHCGGYNARLKIWSASSGIWCFYDYGYLGLSGIYDVMQLQSIR